MTFDPNKIDLPLTALVVSIIALCISILTPSVQFYVAYRDRARLKILRYSWDKTKITVEMVNAGRRPIILRAGGMTIGELTEEGRVVTAPIDRDKGGVRLDELETYVYEFQLREYKNVDTKQLYSGVLWMEDTLDNRYEVFRSRGLLDALREDRRVVVFGPQPPD